MKLRNTLVLIAVLALLGGYVYFFELRKGNEPTANSAAAIVLDLNSAQITGITVTKTQDGVTTTARVQREVGQPWQIEEPVQEPADDVRVNNLTGLLAKLEATRQIEQSASDPSIYGLQPPAFEIVVTLQDGSEQTLTIGEMNPTKSGYYGQHKGDPAVYLLPISPASDLEDWLLAPPKMPTPTPEPTATAKPGA
jgi:hypothetical protein